MDKYTYFKTEKPKLIKELSKKRSEFWKIRVYLSDAIILIETLNTNIKSDKISNSNFIQLCKNIKKEGEAPMWRESVDEAISRLKTFKFFFNN